MRYLLLDRLFNGLVVSFYRLHTIRLFAASPHSSVIVNWVGRTVLVGTIAGRPRSTEMAEEEAGG